MSFCFVFVCFSKGEERYLLLLLLLLLLFFIFFFGLYEGGREGIYKWVCSGKGGGESGSVGRGRVERSGEWRDLKILFLNLFPYLCIIVALNC